MRYRLLGLAMGVAGCAAVAWLGCGGASGDNANGGGGDDAGPDAVATQDASGNADGASDGAAASDAGADGQGSSDAATANDGATNDGGSPGDAGPGGNTTTLQCGATTCAIPEQTCCVQSLGGNALAYSCSSADAGCSTLAGDTTAMQCSSSANCAAGDVCCVRQVNNGAASACQPTCGPNEAQLCDKNAADAGCQGKTCSSNNIGDWGLPSTYATCGGKGN